MKRGYSDGGVSLDHEFHQEVCFRAISYTAVLWASRNQLGFF